MNSKFYVWYDSWGQVARGTRKYGDRVGFPQMEARHLPSLQKYLQTHDAQQIAARIERGALGTLENALRSHGFFDYLMFAAAGGVVAIASSAHLRRTLRGRWPVVLYGAGYFVGYFLMCSWFFAIHSGVRFLVMLVPPALFVGAWLSDRGGHPSFGKVGLFAAAAAVSLAVDAPVAVTIWVETMSGAGW